MIYLIGGIAKSGKTYVATKLTQATAISCFSTDYLMMGLSVAKPECGVHESDDDKTVALALEPILRDMIEAMIENRQNYLLEGVHFRPEFVHQLLEKHPDQIRAVFLGYATVTPAAKLKELSLHVKDSGNDWISRYSPAKKTELIRYLIVESEMLAQTAFRLRLPYYEITDIVAQADDVIDTLLGTGPALSKK